MKIMRFWHFFLSRNPRNIRPESSSLVSTSPTHSGDDEDSEDTGIISLFFCWNLRNLPAESSSKTFASCTGRRAVQVTRRRCLWSTCGRGSGRCDGGTVDVRHRLCVVRGCTVDGVGVRSLGTRKGRRSRVAGADAPIGVKAPSQWPGASRFRRWGRFSCPGGVRRAASDGRAGARGRVGPLSSCCVSARAADGGGPLPGRRWPPRWSARLPSLWCE